MTIHSKGSVQRIALHNGDNEAQPRISADFVETSDAVEVVERILLAVTARRPLIISGEAGCGKSFYLEYAAQKLGLPPPLSLFFDDQADSKSLLGHYTMGSNVGEFVWRPGVVTEALQKGTWLVLEDVDKVPEEILAALVPLLDQRRLVMSDRHVTLEAHPKFHLFATMRSTGAAVSVVDFKEQVGPLLSRWSRLVVPSPSHDTLETLIAHRFPDLTPIIATVLHCFKSVDDTLQAVGDKRRLGVRDLWKWVQRLHSTKFCFTPLFTERERYRLIRQSFVLCAHVDDPDVRAAVLEAMLSSWGLAHSAEAAEARVLLQEKVPINVAHGMLQIGESTLPTTVDDAKLNFAYTACHSRVLEQLVNALKQNEACLLVGDTGTGKTTVVQHLAKLLNKRCIVYNFNDQTESTELLGGFHPVDLVNQKIMPLMNAFVDLFPLTFSPGKNKEILDKACRDFGRKRWRTWLQLIEGMACKAVEKLSVKADSSVLCQRWQQCIDEAVSLQEQLKSNSGVRFRFREGPLVEAMRGGHWILLDEINLAPNDLLQRIQGLVDQRGRMAIPELEKESVITPHPEFRIFACMNPPTLPRVGKVGTTMSAMGSAAGVGKKQLPDGIRSRFTEIFVDEVNAKEDVALIVREQLQDHLATPPTDALVDVYQHCREQSHCGALLDGGQKIVHVSLRNLTRALRFALQVMRRPFQPLSPERALAQGLLMSFSTPLDPESRRTVAGTVEKALGKESAPPKAAAAEAVVKLEDKWVSIDGFWIQRGPLPVNADDAHKKFLVTPSVRATLHNMLRVLSGGRFPILLEGPTSAGKTSLVKFVATLTGHHFVRINNHEHTDLQEYFGQYVCDPDTGHLTFQEGALVRAARLGHWVVLDELNLAPSEVLEALNRLLDDNRVLYIPDTDTTVVPHPDFCVFATQNPAGSLYGGRKQLSKAFRNRFLELYVADIPFPELATILEKRCELPSSFSKVMLGVFNDLQTHRSNSQVFAGKNSFITVRDLLRWGHRKPRSLEELLQEGYALLGERIRKDDDREVVFAVLNKYSRLGAKVALNYAEDPLVQDIIARVAEKRAAGAAPPRGLEHIVWTEALVRMAALVGRCVKHNEPALLVGETGCGKTTICQLLSWVFSDEELRIVNCHQQSEAADFLGSMRPIRQRERIAEDVRREARLLAPRFVELGEGRIARMLDSAGDDVSKILAVLRSWQAPRKKQQNDENCPDSATKRRKVEMHDVWAKTREVLKLGARAEALFAWQDGPLVQAMKEGKPFLLDEISLAEDSVLERLNSVFEPERTLLIPEKPASTTTAVDYVKAKEGFCMFSTMNPGGDFGKKELSPALRNRLTEIWIPAVDFASPDTTKLVRDQLPPLLVGPMIEAVRWFNQKAVHPLTVRDLIGWMSFVSCILKSGDGDRELVEAYVHGGCLVVLDGLGLGNTMHATAVDTTRVSSMLSAAQTAVLQFLLAQIDTFALDAALKDAIKESFGADGFAWVRTAHVNAEGFGMGRFRIPRGVHAPPSNSPVGFDFGAPSMACNVGRIVRAMQVPRAVLLEGPPGIGKTAMVNALAQASGCQLVRINLSEQTDIVDLFGSDLPIDGQMGFQWQDGLLLQAVKAGRWVLLDEINLASQATLEGLNALLDHRKEVYLPEIDRVVTTSPHFRLFATQNPLVEGGGRKGLPRSFLNRFTKLVLAPMQSTDMEHIASYRWPSLDDGTIKKMVTLVTDMHALATRTPFDGCDDWDWNLRDIMRLGDLIAQGMSLCEAAQLVFILRLRRHDDRSAANTLLDAYFPPVTIPDPTLAARHVALERACQRDIPWDAPTIAQQSAPYVGRKMAPSGQLRVGTASLGTIGRRRGTGIQSATFLGSQRRAVQAILHAVSTPLKWPVLLCGATGSGKASTVRFVANEVGAELIEITLTKSMDASELLGCFEQADPRRKVVKFLSKVESAVLDLATKISSDADADVAAVRVSHPAVCAAVDEFRRIVIDDEGVASLRAAIARVQTAFGAQAFAPLHADAQDVLTSFENHVSRFEWIDGALVSAVREGHWVLFSNAQYCASAVLDRLNSLLEPGGFLLITESGQARTFTPHENFRVFFTLNPFGDTSRQVSKALRNRCIEVFLAAEDMTLSASVASGAPCSSCNANEAMLTAPVQRMIDTLPLPEGLVSGIRAPSLGALLEASLIVATVGSLSPSILCFLSIAHHVARAYLAHLQQRQYSKPMWTYRTLTKWAQLVSGTEDMRVVRLAFMQTYCGDVMIDNLESVLNAVTSIGAPPSLVDLMVKTSRSADFQARCGIVTGMEPSLWRAAQVQRERLGAGGDTRMCAGGRLGRALARVSAVQNTEKSALLKLSERFQKGELPLHLLPSPLVAYLSPLLDAVAAHLWQYPNVAALNVLWSLFSLAQCEWSEVGARITAHVVHLYYLIDDSDLHTVFRALHQTWRVADEHNTPLWGREKHCLEDTIAHWGGLRPVYRSEGEFFLEQAAARNALPWDAMTTARVLCVLRSPSDHTAVEAAIDVFRQASLKDVVMTGEGVERNKFDSFLAFESACCLWDRRCAELPPRADGALALAQSRVIAHTGVLDPDETFNALFKAPMTLTPVNSPQIILETRLHVFRAMFSQNIEMEPFLLGEVVDVPNAALVLTQGFFAAFVLHFLRDEVRKTTMVNRKEMLTHVTTLASKVPIGSLDQSERATLHAFLLAQFGPLAPAGIFDSLLEDSGMPGTSMNSLKQDLASHAFAPQCLDAFDAFARQPDTENQGLLWARLGAWRLLETPSVLPSLDFREEVMLYLDDLNAQTDELRADLDFRVMEEQVVQGGRCGPLMASDLESEIDAIQAAKQKLAEHKCLRPGWWTNEWAESHRAEVPKASYHDLCREIRCFVDTVATAEKVESMLDASVDLPILATFSVTCLEFARRLEQRFPLHPDVVQPLCFGVFALVCGLNLKRGPSAWFPKQPLHKLARMPQVPWCTDYGFTGPQATLWLLRWAALANTVKPTISNVFWLSMWEKVEDVACNHVRILAQEEHAREEKEATFQYKKDQEDEDEQDIDLAVQRLFPTLKLAEEDEADPEEDLGRSGLYDQKEEEKKEPGDAVKTASRGNLNKLTDAELDDFCMLSLESFGEPQQQNRKAALESSLDFFCHQMEAANILPKTYEQELLPFLQLRLHHCVSDLTAVQEPTLPDLNQKNIYFRDYALPSKEEGCSFYSQHSPSDMNAAVIPVANVLRHTEELLAEYNDHPTLLTIKASTLKIRELEVLKTPPQHLLTHLELLLQHCDLWEKVAARHVSLQDEIKAIEALVLRLRQKQIADWNSLRANRQKYWESKASVWWLRLIVMVKEATLDEEKGRIQLLENLFLFLRVCPLGQFVMRHRMIKALSAALTKTKHTVAANMLAFTYSFAETWLAWVQQSLSQAQEAMDKEVHELTKIVRWDLSNYHAFKDSITRSHRQLTKVVQRFDGSLQELCDHILSRTSQAPRTPPPYPSCFPVDNILRPEIDAPVLRVMDTPEFWDAAGLEAKADQFAALIQKIAKQKIIDEMRISTNSALDFGKQIATLCADTLQSIKNKDVQVSIKRRQLGTVKDEFEACGLKAKPFVDEDFNVVSQFAISHAFTDPQKWSTHDAQMFHCLHLFEHVRAAKPPPDIPIADYQRWMGIACECLRALHSYRNRCANFDRSCARLRLHAHTLGGVALTGLPIFLSALEESCEGLRQLLVLSPNARSVEQLLTDLDGHAAFFRTCDEVATLSACTERTQVRSIIRDRCANVCALARSTLALEAVGAPIAVVRNVQAQLHALANAMPCEVSRVIPEDDVKDRLRPYLLTIQQAAQKEDATLFGDMLTVGVGLDHTFPVHDLNPEGFPCLAGVTEQALVVADAVLLGGMEAYAGLGIMFAALMELLLGVFEHGLKLPEEKEGEGEGGNQWAEGTGLGDGEGMNDITKEIEDEAQMEGLKGEEKQKEDDAPEDAEHDTAMEVNFDIDQDMQNAPKPKEDDKNDDKKEEDEQNNDRHMDNVDLKDGGQIDEKMWNGEDEEKKEEEKEEEEKRKTEEDIETKGAKGPEDEKDTVAKENEKDNDRKNEAEPKEENAQDNNARDEKDEDGNFPDNDEEDNDHFDVNMPTKDQLNEEQPECPDLDLDDDLNMEGDEDMGEDEMKDGEMEEQKGDGGEEQEDGDEDMNDTVDAEGEKNEEGDAQAEEPDVEMEVAETEQACGGEPQQAQGTQENGQRAEEAEKADVQKDDKEAKPEEGGDQTQDVPGGDDGDHGEDKQKRDTATKSAAESKPRQRADGQEEERELKKVEIQQGDGEDEGGRQDDAADIGAGLHETCEDGQEAVGECKEGEEAPDLGALDDEDTKMDTENKDSTHDTDDVKKDKEKTIGKCMDAAVDERVEGEAQHLDDDALLQGLTDPSLHNTHRDACVAHAHVLDDDTKPASEDGDVEMEDHIKQERSERFLLELWARLDQSTGPLAAQLSEQLRIILEPTLKGRLQGDYKTGKRISMRKVIPFIASQYRRDKIWLRRTKPSKRVYQVILAMDNSRSMSECDVGPLALQSLFTLCQALSRVEVGDYGLIAFGGQEPEVLLPLSPCVDFTYAKGRPILERLTFDRESANSHNRGLQETLHLAMNMFDERSGTGGSFKQLLLIVTDGRFNKRNVRTMVHQAVSRQLLPLMIIVDPHTEGKASSVFDLKAVTYQNGACKVTPYLEDFPFPYYTVIQNIKVLPQLFADVLRQWFELTN